MSGTCLVRVNCTCQPRGYKIEGHQSQYDCKRLRLPAVSFRREAQSLAEVTNEDALARVKSKYQCFTTFEWYSVLVVGREEERAAAGSADERPRALVKFSIEVSVLLPETLEVRVRGYSEFPKSVFLCTWIRIACGCDKCQPLQAKWTENKPLLQGYGFWALNRFIEHVTDCKLPKPKPMPKKRARSVEGAGEGGHVEEQAEADEEQQAREREEAAAARRDAKAFRDALLFVVKHGDEEVEMNRDEMKKASGFNFKFSQLRASARGPKKL